MNLNTQSALQAVLAVAGRWEVAHSVSVLLQEDTAYVGRLSTLAQKLANLRAAALESADDMSAVEGYECAIHDVLSAIADECVRIVLGDSAAQAAADAAELAAAKQLARRLRVPHTFCV